MYRRILLAVDGSPHSERAIAAAADLAGLVAGAALLVVHVLRPVDPSALNSSNPLHFKDLVDRQRADGEELVASVRSRLEEQGIAVDSRVMWGNPAGKLVEQAEEWGAELIIMGSRGLSAWKGLLLGSTSHQTIQESNCPVLVVK